MDRFELAWAAGFFDGEGWANAVAQAGRRTRQPHAQVNQADPQGVPEVLTRFQTALGGLGRISGPVEKDGRKDLYTWIVSSRHDVEVLHHFLMPWVGQVKLDELAEALGRKAARSRQATRSDVWIAWCAGLFDGEGWASMYAHRSHEGYLSGEIGVGQSSASGVPEVLTRFAQLTGAGRIYGPYRQKRSMPIYRLKALSLADIHALAEHLRPWLGSIKRADVDLVIEILDAQPTLPRGNPSWGRRGPNCPKGHPFEAARLRPYAPRREGTKPSPHRGCLVCLREYARLQREKKKARQ